VIRGSVKVSAVTEGIIGLTGLQSD